MTQAHLGRIKPQSGFIPLDELHFLILPLKKTYFLHHDYCKGEIGTLTGKQIYRFLLIASLFSGGQLLRDVVRTPSGLFFSLRVLRKTLHICGTK